LRAWKREHGDATPNLFTCLHGGPLMRRTVHQVVAEAAKAASIDFPVHPTQAPACDKVSTSQTRARDILS